MSQFDVIVSEYKDMMQLRMFAEAQYSTIINLTKKIQKLEEDNKHLEELLEKTNPLELGGEKGQIVPIDLNSTDSEIIARTQLALLKASSMTGELTLEESKKVQIFTDILQSLNQKQETDGQTKIEAIDTAALLEALKEPST